MFDKIYNCGDFYMLRTPILDSSIYLNLMDSLSKEDTLNRISLSNLKNDEVIKGSLAIASLDLYHEIKRTYDKNINKLNQNLSNSIMKYLIRMSTRPTPYGTFSGVTCGTFSDNTNIMLASSNEHIKRARADMIWIYGIVKKLEKDKTILNNIKVRFNNQCYSHGNRMKNPYRTNYGQTYNQNENDSKFDKSNIRYTQLVKFVQEFCKTLVSYKDLCSSILEKYDDVPIEIVEKFLRGLIDNEFLITELRPPIYCKDPLDYIISLLSMVDSKNNILHNLKIIQYKINKFNQEKIGNDLQIYLEIINLMESMYKSNSYLQIDMSIACINNSISSTVKQELDNLSKVLTMIAEEYNEPSYLKQYREKFMERYGVDTEVSLLELTDNDIGLGFPDDYDFNYSYIRSNRLLSRREERFKKLINDKIIKTIQKQDKQINITDEELKYVNEEFKVDNLNFSKSFELNVIITSESQEEIDKGNFQLNIGPNYGSDKAGNMFSRFSDLLEEKYIQKLNNLYESEKKDCKDEYVIVDIHEMYRNGRINNILNNSSNHDYHIVLSANTSSPDRELDISDIYIGIDENTNRFYVKSKKLNSKLKVISDNMLNTASCSKINRLLREISNAYEVHIVNRLINITNKDYKYIPRIVYGKTILSSARWTIYKDDFREIDNLSRFKIEIQEFINSWEIPRYVYETKSDNRLLLDLKKDVHIEYLYKLLKNSFNPIILTELEGNGFDNLWVKDKKNMKYFSEIVVPFVLSKKSVKGLHPKENRNVLETKSDIGINKNTISIIDDKRLVCPGDNNWIYFKLYGTRTRINELIGIYLNEFLEPLLESGSIDKYFFIRYADPEQHIRLRINGSSDISIFQLLPQIIKWIKDMQRDGLVSRFTIDTYERELERYGGVELITYAEEVFFRDSMLVSRILGLKERKNFNIEDDILGIIGIMTLIDKFIADVEMEENFLSRVIQKNEYRDQFVKERNKYIDTVNSILDWQESNDLIEMNVLRDLLILRNDSILKYRKMINEVDDLGNLTNTKANILLTVIHMFCNRFMGDRNWERKILALTRHSLYAINAKKRNMKKLVGG